MEIPAMQELTQQQIDFYRQQGYLHIPGVFDSAEIAQMCQDLDWMIRVWANVGVGWTGPWRQALMDVETEAKSQLIAMHDLQYYAESWMKAVTHPRIASAMSQLLAGEDEPDGAPVELHHSTMHVKPPETGHPFPMHQDKAFYSHADNRFVAALVHLNDTCHENGEIRFLPGSHKNGPLDHHTSYIDENGKKQGCTPHLPWKDYPLADTIAVPAKAGDLVCFNIHTVHGSYVNTTGQMRRMVRVGYKHPDNFQEHGQSNQRPGLMVKGTRRRHQGQLLFSTECVGQAEIVNKEEAVATE